MKPCRDLGCLHPREPGSSWCRDHQLIRWQSVPLDMRRAFADRSVRDITTNPTGCWLYAGRRNPTSGYAQDDHAGERVFVHRWLFWFLVGALDPDKELHHICGGLDELDTRHCINPSHLVQLHPDDHDEETRLRALMLAAAEPGSRFHQGLVLDRGHAHDFARAHDLPRLEARFSTDESTPEELVTYWELLIPERFTVPNP